MKHICHFVEKCVEIIEKCYFIVVVLVKSIIFVVEI